MRQFCAAAVAVLSLWALGAAASDQPVETGLRGPARGAAAAGPAVASLAPFAGSEAVSEADLLAAGVRTGSDPVAPYDPAMNRGEVVINWDSRMELKTGLYPNRAVGLITYRGSHHCTGWLISSNTVATAGHCVHQGGGGSWYDRTQMRFYPGRDGGAAPYGSCGVVRLHSVNGWTVSGSPYYDYGAMRLDCAVGNTVGWFGIYVRTRPRNEPAIITGYPGDKPQTQWISSDRIRTVLARQLRYRMDTAGGMSGSPVWSDRDAALAGSGAWGYAIHAYGYASSEINGGTRIVAAARANYLDWVNRP